MKDSWIVARNPDPDIKLTSERFRMELRYRGAAKQLLKKPTVIGSVI
jgi:hypothetical protein